MYTDYVILDLPNLESTPSLNMFANAQSDLAIALVVVLVTVGVAAWLVVLSRKRLRTDPNEIWGPIYLNATIEYQRLAQEQPVFDEPVILVEFHTYSGLLVFFVQTPHRMKLPARHACLLAAALHRYNLKACLIPYPGIVFVPVLSWLNLRSTRRAALKAASQHGS